MDESWRRDDEVNVDRARRPGWANGPERKPMCGSMMMVNGTGGDKVVEDASDVSVEHGRGRVVHGRHGGGRGSRTAVDEDEFGSEDDAELGYLWLQEQII